MLYRMNTYLLDCKCEYLIIYLLLSCIMEVKFPFIDLSISLMIIRQQQYWSTNNLLLYHKIYLAIKIYFTKMKYTFKKFTITYISSAKQNITKQNKSKSHTFLINSCLKRILNNNITHDLSLEELEGRYVEALRKASTGLKCNLLFLTVFNVNLNNRKP